MEALWSICRRVDNGQYVSYGTFETLQSALLHKGRLGQPLLEEDVLRESLDDGRVMVLRPIGGLLEMFGLEAVREALGDLGQCGFKLANIISKTVKAKWRSGKAHAAELERAVKILNDFRLLITKLPNKLTGQIARSHPERLNERQYEYRWLARREATEAAWLIIQDGVSNTPRAYYHAFEALVALARANNPQVAFGEVVNKVAQEHNQRLVRMALDGASGGLSLEIANQKLSPHRP